MSSHLNFLQQTAGLLEFNNEIKSYIHQQIFDFEPFITEATTILVIARDPFLMDDPSDEDSDRKVASSQPVAAHRIVIILKEEDGSIEAEAFHDDIFHAIKMAKEKLIVQLQAIQNELENSQERLEAIQQASTSKQIH